MSQDLRSALDRISANSLRGHLSFIASDLLAGRDTPSPGLDIAAEYIAAQFRRAGLEPAGDGGYFQTATLALQQPDLEGFALTFTEGTNSLAIAADHAGLRIARPLDLTNAAVYKLQSGDEHAQLDGKIVILESDRALLRRVRSANPALLLVLSRAGSPPDPGRVQMIDPEDPAQSDTPRISLYGDAAAQFFEHLKPGLSETAVVSVHAAAPKSKPVLARNVVAILRGSDPALKDTCVLLTAHYDHLGARHNGANDDGSGTVSVIEIASVLAGLKQRPKRSIVFAAFFGEEKGLFGSRYYARHPVMPLARTVAQINLEQLGRTDATEGERVEEASLTGFDYSDVAAYVKAAGQLTGIKLHKDDANSDRYFGSSDNLSLAEAGVPAHTLAVAYQFPDYHGAGDDWPKIDYENMAKVDRMAAVALMGLASSAQAPRWNESNGKADRFRTAREEGHP